MKVSVYTSFQDVPDALRSDLSYPRQPNVFLSFNWFSLLFGTSLSQTMKPRIYVLTDDQNRAVAALFCGVMQSGAIRRLGSLTNFYTMEYGPSIVDENIDAAIAIRRLIEHIRGEQPRWHIVNLRFLKETAFE